MAGDRRPSTATQTSQLLRELLLSRPEYRRRWQEQGKRRRADSISRAGVAQVIALYLWRSGERPDSKTSLPRDIKDRIRRALAGESITPQTLTWFVEAFDMDRRDESSLWAAFAGDRDKHVGISYTITTDRELALRQRHRTIALFLRYAIGADRSFVECRSLHTIMALEDGVDVYPFSHEPEVNRIEVLHGGSLGPRYTHGDGLVTDAVALERKLWTGETIALEYACQFPPGDYSATEIRRSAHGRTENVDIAVRFDGSALPRSVSWAVWADDRDGPPVSEEPASLDNRHSARRFIRFIEETVVGFHIGRAHV